MSVMNIKELLSKRILESEKVNKEIPLLKTIDDDKLSPPKTLSEIDVGIRAYVSNHEGFTAVIKHRFSDFHVHEIDSDGNVVRLTATTVPECQDDSAPPSTDVIDSELWEDLDKLEAGLTEMVQIDVSNDNKNKRTDIHRSIKAKYGQKFISNTKEEGDKKLIVVRKNVSGKRDTRWPAHLGKYLYFVMFKSNMDTSDALSVIGTKLHVKLNYFTYAGTKDRRGNTSQRVSVKFITAQRLQSITKSLRNIMIGNYSYKNVPLKLGDLRGNQFDIVLRNVSVADDVVEEAITQVNTNGFLNYYGLQRFGNSSVVPTYEIGKALVKGDFKRAVELILKPKNDGSLLDTKRAREIWWNSRDAATAFKELRSKTRTTEGKLLQGLAKHGANAYINALDAIPRNTRLLYMHSYQSFLWNKVLSKRIESFGLSVLEGDLIFISDCVEELEKTSDSDNEVNDSHEQPAVENPAIVRHLSKEELDRFSIYDIVHPLSGHAVLYPSNIIGKWYEEVLAEDNLTSEKLKLDAKKYSLSGTYRKIIKRVNNLEWKIIKYSDPDQDILQSDADLLNKNELHTDNGSKELKAVVLSFTLDTCTYATMLLREILKVDTSVSFQAQLTFNNKRKAEDREAEGTKKLKDDSEQG